MDKSWMAKPRYTTEYEMGLEQFLDMAFDKACLSGKIICPCKVCKTGRWLNRDTAKEHLIVDGFLKGYTDWILHGEDSSSLKIMDENKDGQSSTYGTGSATTGACRGKRSRAALSSQTMELEEMYLCIKEKQDILSAKLDTLATNVYRRLQSTDQFDLERDPLASSKKHHSSVSTSGQIMVGSFVALKSLGNANEIIATGFVNKMENVQAKGTDLGPKYCQIMILRGLQKDARLLFSHSNVETIGDALGKPVAWPLSLVSLDEDKNGML